MTKRYPDFNNEKKPVKAEPGAQVYITQGANGGLPDKVVTVRSLTCLSLCSR